MGPIQWEAKLETHHARIDEQHRQMAEAFNAIYAAMQHSETISGPLVALKDITIEHFQTEEDLMDRFGYPGAVNHKDLHHKMVVQLSDLVRRHLAGIVSISFPTMHILEGWLVEHIQGEDMRLAEFLRSKGEI